MLTQPSADTVVIDCSTLTTRDLNAQLRGLPDGVSVELCNPQGRHNLAVGITSPIDVTVRGNAGYFVGGLSGTPDGGPNIVVDGFAGWAAGENLMGGRIVIRGNTSQSVGASAHGGVIVVEGDASLRAGISLKGATIVVAGDVGAMTGFMAQLGTILVGGDTGPALGDSLYEAVIYVGGNVSSLGADAHFDDLTDDDVAAVERLVTLSGFTHVAAGDVRKVTSRRSLYNFAAGHHHAY